jgi:hypothetical protein
MANYISIIKIQTSYLILLKYDQMLHVVDLYSLDGVLPKESVV